MNYIIRKAELKDARSIVEVNTYTWLTTYKDLMPAEVLENRKKTMDERVNKRIKDIKEKNDMYVAEVDGKVVGIMSYGPSRNEEYPNMGEIYSLYVLDEYQGLGLGKKLFMTGVKELLDSGYHKMIINVLEGNKTIHFYEKYGGKNVGERVAIFAGHPLKENIMYYEDLNETYKNN